MEKDLEVNERINEKDGYISTNEKEVGRELKQKIANLEASMDQIKIEDTKQIKDTKDVLK